jgi:hypothetical protein
MPGPIGNQNAAKAPEDRADDHFHLRTPYGLKWRAIRASRAKNQKLTPWLIDAIDEKATREGFPDKEKE